MDNSARCWLVVAAVAPLVAVVSFWSILTFHSYRRQWRTVDLFFVAAAAQEFLNAVFFFGHALLNLTQPSLLSVCTFFVWATLAVRIFQVTTLTSLVMDRALTIRWPYRYRLSVRRNQVRYHIGVLAVTSVLVGVASVFAKSEDPIMSLHSDEWDVGDVYVYHPPPCFLLPFSLDKKFVIFAIFLQALLALISLVCLVHVQIKMCTTSPQSKEHIQVSSNASMPHPFLVLDSSPPHTLVSPSSTASSGTAIMSSSSTHGCLNRTLWSLAPSAIRANSSLKRESVRLRREFRWKAVAMVVIACNLVNHLPYLVMVIMARFVAILPPLWLESVATYLALVEGLLLPLLFWAVDPMYRAAVAHTFVRTLKTGKSPATTYLGSELDGGSFSRRESLSCSTLPRLEPLSMYSSVNGFLCSNTLDKKILLGAESRWIKENVAKEDPVQYINGKNPRSYSSSRCNDNFCRGEEDLGAKYRAAAKEREARLNCTGAATVNEPVYCDPTEMMIMMEQTSKARRPNKTGLEEHIYATLSNRFSTPTEKSAADMSDDDKDTDLNEEEDDDDDSSSFTTSASDDFEFHLTRPASCMVQTITPSNNQFRGYGGMNHMLLKSDVETSSPRADQSKRPTASRDVLWEEPKEMITSSASPSRASTMSLRSEEEVARPSYHGRSSPQRRSPKGGRNRISASVANAHSLSRVQRNASLSMNDLDLLNGNECEEEPEEVVYVLSGKSESSISLYRLNHGLSDDGTLDRPLRSPAHRAPVRWASQNAMQTRSNVENSFRPRRHSANSLDGGDVIANNVVLKRQYTKNPSLLSRTRFSKCANSNNNGTPHTPNNKNNNNCNYYNAGNNNNWKYRAAALPRKEFPWRKSPNLPFQIPTTLTESNEYRSQPFLNPQSKRMAHQHSTSYQKKFISEFL